MSPKPNPLKPKPLIEDCHTAYDPASDAADHFFLNGHDAATAWVSKSPILAAGHALAAALIYASQQLAESIDRNTQAIAAQQQRAASSDHKSTPTA